MLKTDTPDERLSYIAFPDDLHLQLLFRLANVLPGLLESLLHVRDFLLNLSAAFGSVHLQKEMVPILKGFLVVGNPAKVLRKRFDDGMIALLLQFQWWDKSVDEINRLIPVLTCSDLEQVRAELKKRLNG